MGERARESIVDRVRRLVDNKTPFLIVKYGVTFIDITSNNYDLVTMYGDKLNYTPMERKEVMQVLRDFDLPKLWDAGDNHNTIWGDEKFKEKFKKGGYKI
jgi:hypothetical protein